jgi:cytosine/adenosine deaminase-related metal-dependent hydrolase
VLRQTSLNISMAKPARETIFARGKIVAPGLIDADTH